jgi:hypothetical protein
VPSDFYLLGKLKGALAGQKCESTEELFGDQGVTDSIGLAELETIFEVWEQRLHECIQIKAESIA